MLWRGVALSALVATVPFMAMLTPADIDDIIVRHTYQYYSNKKRNLTPTGEYYLSRLFLDSIDLQAMVDPQLIMLRHWCLSEYRRIIEEQVL